MSDFDLILQYQQQVVRLQALLEATRRVHATIELDEVIGRSLEIAVKELELPAASFEAFGQTFGEIPAGTPSTRYPVRDKQGVEFGALAAAHRPGAPLSLEEQDFLEGLALQTAVAVENARYHARSMEWQRLQQDLQAARAIQRSLLPQKMPVIPGYGVATRSQACYEVGGDYLDILTLPSGEYVMVVADVAGKGLASALVSNSFRSAFRAMALAGLPLDELAMRMNELHFAEGSEARRRYVTAIFLRLHPGEHKIEVLNAGHNPGFIAAGGAVVEIGASGPPLGMLPRMRYSLERHDLSGGAGVLFYTDGLTEVFQGDEEFGPARLSASFAGCTHLAPDAILDQLWKELAAFSSGGDQSDDMTALTLRRL